jgi:hypothetical protein
MPYPLDCGECLVVYGSGQIDTAELGAERGAGRDNLDRHRRAIATPTAAETKLCTVSPAIPPMFRTVTMPPSFQRHRGRPSDRRAPRRQELA